MTPAESIQKLITQKEAALIHLVYLYDYHPSWNLSIDKVGRYIDRIDKAIAVHEKRLNQIRKCQLPGDWPWSDEVKRRLNAGEDKVFCTVCERWQWETDGVCELGQGKTLTYAQFRKRYIKTGKP